jgi:hypothetical protein
MATPTLLSPISVMKWFEMLLDKCQKSFDQMVDGSLSCEILESASSQYHSSIDSAQLVC